MNDLQVYFINFLSSINILEVLIILTPVIR